MGSEKLGQDVVVSEVDFETHPVKPKPTIPGAHLAKERPVSANLGRPEERGAVSPLGGRDLSPRLASVIDLALNAGAKHQERMMALREALIAGVCPEEVVVLAREACGLSEVDCHVAKKGR